MFVLRIKNNIGHICDFERDYIISEFYLLYRNIKTIAPLVELKVKYRSEIKQKICEKVFFTLHNDTDK